MKTKKENSFVRSIVFCFSMVFTLIISIGTSYCQDQNNLTFNDCKNYEDTCLFIGEMFIKNLSEQKFENLVYLFSDNIMFRALIPSSVVTLNKPDKTADKIKSWFFVKEPEKFEILDSSFDVLVNCLHVNYKVFITYKGNSYNVEQHLYCEVEAGRINKLSLICSGFRKLIE